MENKELLSHVRVYRKSATSTQTDGQTATDRTLYTGSHFAYDFSRKIFLMLFC